MKPAAFECVRARSIADATQLLAQAGEGGRLIAGGQSLGPMLNLRLVQPAILIDIRGVPAMARIEENDESVTLGACVTTSDIEDGRVPVRGLDLLRSVARRIAFRAIRNRGTVGGSVCHADPAADWITTLCALGAHCMIVGPEGSRCLPIQKFVLGAFETAIGPGELLEAIRIPRLSPSGRWGYHKLCRRAGEFATAIAAVLSDPAREEHRMVIGATGNRPIVVDDARMLWRNMPGGSPVLDRDEVYHLFSRFGVVDPVHRRQHSVALQRAFDQAMHQ